MLALSWLLMMMMMMMKTSDASSAEFITARRGDAVLLTSGLLGGRPHSGEDVRWTHPHLMMSLKNNRTTCHHGRCELRSDGSLSFSRVDAADAGNYTLSVYDGGGGLVDKKDFVLSVDGISSPSSSSSSSLMSPLIICFLLLLFIIIIVFILRRRSQRTTAAGPPEENVYVVMRGHHGNKEKGEEKKQEREEDCSYVSCNAVVSMETPITLMSVDEDDVYV